MTTDHHFSKENFQNPSPTKPTIPTSTSHLSSHKENLSKSLIIHFHGGGFVAQTASSHLTHLRQWAKDTSAPVFTIDYRLAPEYPFPVAFQECYYSYMWALANCRKLGSTGERIVVVGDSAGGNLAAAVTVRAIVENVRVPDGLILVYPAVYMLFVPSPSRLLSAVDPLLHTSTLKTCFDAYHPKEEGVDALENPFLSPASASEEILAKFPDKTFIMCGTLDPLFDDTIHFAKRLVAVGKPVQLKIYDNMPHGFLNLGAVPALGKEMWASVAHISHWMNEVFDQPPTKKQTTTTATTTKETMNDLN
jgi:hormone-sensitive lipase